MLHILSFHIISPQSDVEFDYMPRVLYSSVVGFLIYVIICTHPDLAYIVNIAKRYLINHGEGH